MHTFRQQHISSISDHKTRTDHVYQSIRRDIISGNLKPDHKLKMGVLCKKYNIGTSPVREALARLMGENLVVTKSYRGFWAAPFSGDELVDVFQLRILLGVEALQLSMKNGKGEWRMELTRAFQNLVDAELGLNGRRRKFVSEWEYAHQHFHETLVNQCCSIWLQHMLTIMFVQTERYCKISREGFSIGRSLRDEFEGIYDAVMADNILRAARLFENHLQLTCDVLLKANFEKPLLVRSKRCRLSSKDRIVTKENRTFQISIGDTLKSPVN